MADQYAENGYYTLIPDLFNGDALSLNRPEGFDLMAWLTKGTGGNNPHTYEAVDPIVEKSIKYLQEKGFKKIGAVGYCFVRIFGCSIELGVTDWTQGAKYVVRFMPKGKGIDVGFLAHPSCVPSHNPHNRIPINQLTTTSQFRRRIRALSNQRPVVYRSRRNRPNLPRGEAPQIRDHPR